MAKARKKFETESSSPNSFSELFQNSMNEIINPKDLPDQVCIPTGISIVDKILGGGFLTGTFNSFAAPSGSGKSTMCLCVEREFKKMYPDGFVIHMDTEQATTDLRMKMIGVPIDTDERIWKISYSMTIEEVFQAIDQFIALKEKWANDYKDPSFRSIPSLIVLDSVDASPTIKELEVDSVEKAIGQKPKQLKFFLTRVLRSLRKYNICLLSVSHITKKLDMQGPYTPYDGGLASLKGFTIAGGKPVIYLPSSLIFLRGHEPTKLVKEKFESKYHLNSAFICSLTTLKCKNFSYNMTVDVVFDTIKGFDDFHTKVYNMDESEWFVSEGRSFLLRNYPGFKFKLEDLDELYKTDETFKQKFEETWNDYMLERFGRFIETLDILTRQSRQIDISGITENIDISVLEDIAKEASSSNGVGISLTPNDDGTIQSESDDTLNIPTMPPSFSMPGNREAVFEEPKNVNEEDE